MHLAAILLATTFAISVLGSPVGLEMQELELIESFLDSQPKSHDVEKVASELFAKINQFREANSLKKIDEGKVKNLVDIWHLDLVSEDPAKVDCSFEAMVSKEMLFTEDMSGEGVVGDLYLEYFQTAPSKYLAACEINLSSEIESTLNQQDQQVVAKVSEAMDLLGKEQGPMTIFSSLSLERARGFLKDNEDRNLHPTSPGMVKIVNRFYPSQDEKITTKLAQFDSELCNPIENSLLDEFITLKMIMHGNLPNLHETDAFKSITNKAKIESGHVTPLKFYLFMSFCEGFQAVQ